MKTKTSLPMLAALFAMAAFFLVPQVSFAKKVVCKPKHYCYVASWGCMPCKYVKKAVRLDKNIKKAGKNIKKNNANIKKTKNNIKKLTGALAKLQRQLKRLKTKQKTLHRTWSQFVVKRRATKVARVFFR